MADIIREGKDTARKLSSRGDVNNDDDNNGANDDRWFWTNKPLWLFNDVMPVLGKQCNENTCILGVMQANVGQNS